MPRRKRLEAYPEEYQTFFREAFDKEIRFVYPNVDKAKSVRGELYNYRSALREAAKEDSDADPLSSQILKDALIAEAIELVIESEPTGRVALLIRRKTTVHVNSLRRSLETPIRHPDPDPPSQPPEPPKPGVSTGLGFLDEVFRK